MDIVAPLQGYFMRCIRTIEAALQVEVHHYKGFMGLYWLWSTTTKDMMSAMYNRVLEELFYRNKTILPVV